MTALPTPAFAQAPAVDAKALLADANKAAAAKDWTKAQSSFRAAHAAAPNAQAVNGLANASYELQSWGEAYEAYDEFVRVYPDAMGKGARGVAEKRLKELESKTGAITILVNENGADVSIDDRKIGVTPVRALQRVTTGPHRVKVTKAGFAPFDKTVDVGSNAKISVDANLSREAKAGRLAVKESTGKTVRVIIDGTDVGGAPWEGELPAGPHDVAVRSADLGSPTQKVEIEAGKTAEVSIAASSALGRIEIRTSDGLGNIYLDGKLVGEGQFAGDVPAGSHTIRVAREGFVPFEKRIELAEKASVSESVTLRREGQSLQAVEVEQERVFYGLYGGFGLFGAFGVGGMNSGLEGDSCKTRRAESCETPNPIGAGAFGYVGFTFLPVGFELFLGAMFDQNAQKAQFGEPDPTKAAILGPRRTEEFKTIRAGGVAALRVRATYDSRVVRLSVAVGPGIAYKQMFLEREATTPTNFKDRYVPDDGKTNAGELEPNKLSYVGPALTSDIAVHVRISPTVAISGGLLAWVESAGKDLIVQGDKNRFLVGPQGSTPIGLPVQSYEPAVSAQFFLGPYLGMMFGP